MAVSTGFEIAIEIVFPAQDLVTRIRPIYYHSHTFLDIARK